MCVKAHSISAVMGSYKWVQMQSYKFIRTNMLALTIGIVY